jgi:exopolysaccharide production protein ExoZ
MARRILSIQALRFFAAAMVVHMHALQLSRLVAHGDGVLGAGHLSQLGAAGVDIFFVLSGFVIALTGPMASPRPTGAAFFWRRWRRVAPIFFLLSAPLILERAVHGGLRLEKTIATFLFWPQFGPRFVQPYIAAGWTLSFEMLFYSAVALVLAGGRVRRNLAICATVVLALIALRQTTDWNTPRLLANGVFLEFGFGVALACLLPRLRALDARVGFCLIGLAVGVFGLEAWLGMGDAFSWQATLTDQHALFRVGVFGAPAALLVAGTVIADRAFRGPLARILARLGDASYAIYLIHGLVIAGLTLAWRHAVFIPSPDLVVVTTFAAAVAAGWASHIWIETPLLGWLSRIPSPRLWSFRPASGLARPSGAVRVSAAAD